MSAYKSFCNNKCFSSQVRIPGVIYKKDCLDKHCTIKFTNEKTQMIHYMNAHVPMVLLYKEKDNQFVCLSCDKSWNSKRAILSHVAGCSPISPFYKKKPDRLMLLIKEMEAHIVFVPTDQSVYEMEVDTASNGLLIFTDNCDFTDRGVLECKSHSELYADAKGESKVPNLLKSKYRMESMTDMRNRDASKIKEICKPIVVDILKFPHASGIFGAPVDPVTYGLPDYFEVVKVPMDLGTVLKRLDSLFYHDLHNFVSDVHLTFNNAMMYNPKSSDVHGLATALKRDFDIRYRQKTQEFYELFEASMCNTDACLVCREISLKFDHQEKYWNPTFPSVLLPTLNNRRH